LPHPAATHPMDAQGAVASAAAPFGAPWQPRYVPLGPLRHAKPHSTLASEKRTSCSAEEGQLVGRSRETDSVASGISVDRSREVVGGLLIGWASLSVFVAAVVVAPGSAEGEALRTVTMGGAGMVLGVVVAAVGYGLLGLVASAAGVVMALFLPALLNAAVGGNARAEFETVAEWLPNVVSTGLLVALGWILGRAAHVALARGTRLVHVVGGVSIAAWLLFWLL